MQLKVITPERVLFEKEILKVSLPGQNGEMEVLPGHVPLVSLLKAGEVLVTTAEGEEEPFAIAGGFVEVIANRVLIMPNTAEHVRDIDEKRAEEARDRAEAILKDKKSTDSQEYAYYLGQLEKEVTRVNLAQKYRTRVRKNHL